MNLILALIFRLQFQLQECIAWVLPKKGPSNPPRTLTYLLIMIIVTPDVTDVASNIFISEYQMTPRHLCIASIWHNFDNPKLHLSRNYLGPPPTQQQVLDHNHNELFKLSSFPPFLSYPGVIRYWKNWKIPGDLDFQFHLDPVVNT